MAQGQTMRALVCGDRRWTDEGKIHERLRQLEPGTTVIAGGARGADCIAATVARKLGFNLIEVMAEWERFGRAAGPKRNAEMLKCGPDVVIAFHENLAASKGTKNCVEQARKMGIPVEVIQ